MKRLTSILLASSFIISNNSYSEENLPILDFFNKAAKIEYVKDDPLDPNYDFWQYPFETEEWQKGDCEDKSFYLYQLLKDNDHKSKVVWGDLGNNAHLWVEYNHNKITYILDPTINLIIEKEKSNEYDYKEESTKEERQEIETFLKEMELIEKNRNNQNGH